MIPCKGGTVGVAEQGACDVVRSDSHERENRWYWTDGMFCYPEVNMDTFPVWVSFGLTQMDAYECRWVFVRLSDIYYVIRSGMLGGGTGMWSILSWRTRRRPGMMPHIIVERHRRLGVPTNSARDVAESPVLLGGAGWVLLFDSPKYIRESWEAVGWEGVW